VLIIATMNTADRSIALVDHALRRRFSFITVRPAYDVLQGHLDREGVRAKGIVDALQRVNREIDNPNYELGISFFIGGFLLWIVLGRWFKIGDTTLTTIAVGSIVAEGIGGVLQSILPKLF
jgi:hypothetical protein